ncbi:MAG: NnrS family protein [Burkholderiales bacterium]|nr:NnrS family protein [Burkholderiales bacterium]
MPAERAAAPDPSSADERPAPTAPQRARFTPHLLFFPAATLYGALLLPWSVGAMLLVAPAPASLATPFGHAHEMLLGYALAVVAGYQLPPMARARAFALFAVWVAARVAFLGVHGVLGVVFDIAFAAVLALHVAPRLFRAAKKVRNQALPLVLTALCAGAVAFDIALLASGAATLQALTSAVVLLLTTLMLFMGGRIIAPAAAGQRYRQGEALAARVQPRLEGALLVVMAAAVALVALPALDGWLRLACAAAGVLALVRLARWQLWACRGRPDLVCLGMGYAWLGAGLLAVAATPPGALRTAALHLITIGALGTLTLNVMASTLLLRLRRSPATERTLVVATVLVGSAAVLRVAAAAAPVQATPLLLAAATCWSAGCLAALWLIGRSARAVAKRVPRPHEPA